MSNIYRFELVASSVNTFSNAILKKSYQEQISKLPRAAFRRFPCEQALTRSMSKYIMLSYNH